MMAGAMLATPMTLTAPGAPAADITSSQASCSGTVAPRPPYSSGQAGAAHPASASVRFHSRRTSMLSSLMTPPPAATSFTSAVRWPSSHAASSARNASAASSSVSPTRPVPLIGTGRCRSSLEADATLGAVVGGQLGLRLEARRDLGGEDHAVALVIAVEELGGQRVAATVASAPLGVEDDSHRAGVYLRSAGGTGGPNWVGPGRLGRFTEGSVMPEAVIVSACRTAIGTSIKGTLSETEATVLARSVVDESMLRTGIAAKDIDDLILAESMARRRGDRPLRRRRGRPENVPGLAQNRHCAAGLAAVQTGGRLHHGGMDRR